MTSTPKRSHDANKFSTIGGTTCKALYKSSSLSSLTASSIKYFPCKHDEKYEAEFSYYLLRKLQAKMASQDEEREKNAKKSLLLLTMNYEGLVKQNVCLTEEFTRIDGFDKCIEELDGALSEAREVLRELRDKELERLLKDLALDFECSSNQMQLVDLNRKDIDDAFDNNILGYKSDLYKLLKKMQEYVSEHNGVIPEIVEEIKEIKNLHKENEELKKRCIAIGTQLQSKSIASNYKKYLEIAKKECEDIIENVDQDSPTSNMNKSLPDSLHLGKPTSCSTPAN